MFPRLTRSFFKNPIYQVTQPEISHLLIGKIDKMLMVKYLGYRFDESSMYEALF
jgi:hypothetical protein